MSEGKSITSIRPDLFVLSAINIGGGLEWYEIGLFFSWPLIIHEDSNFFVQTLADSLNITGLLLMAILALASGGARALGGWYFGKIGDEEGRKKAFSLSILFATFPSLILPLISFFMSYTEWIRYSTIIFAAVKFFQGMPAGGEFPGAICYLSETRKIYQNVPQWVSRRYLCSFTVFGPQIGLMLSMIICLILKSIFSLETLQRHWQYVFFSSGLMGIGGFLMRKILHETYSFQHLHHKVTLHPVRTVFTKYFSRLVFGFNLSIFETVSFIVISLIPLFYLKTPYLLPYDIIILLSVLSTVLRSVFLILIGRLAIKYFDFPWLKLSVWGMIFFSVFLYFSYLQESLLFSVLINIVILFLYSIQAAILPSLLAELFPTRVRYTGIAFSFNICDAILLTVITSICYMVMSKNSASFVFLLTISGIIYLINMKNKLWRKRYYK